MIRRLQKLNHSLSWNKRFFAASGTPASSPKFEYAKLFNTSDDKTTQYRLITKDYVETKVVGDKEFLFVKPEGLRILSSNAFKDIAHLLRPAHLQQLSNILKDPEATDNVRLVSG